MKEWVWEDMVWVFLYKKNLKSTHPWPRKSYRRAMSQMQSATGHEKPVDNKPFCRRRSWTVDFLWKEIEKLPWIRKISKCNDLNIRFPISEKLSSPARLPIRRIVRLRCHVNYNLVSTLRMNIPLYVSSYTGKVVISLLDLWYWTGKTIQN